MRSKPTAPEQIPDDPLPKPPFRPGVVEVLDQLAVASCVASSGSHEKMRLTLGSTRLHDRFKGRIFSADDVV